MVCCEDCSSFEIFKSIFLFFLDFFIKEYDFVKLFSFEKAGMLWLGFYPNQNILNSYFYYFNCVTVIIIELYMELTMIIFVLTNYDDMEKISETILFLVTETAFIIKLAFFTYHKSKLIALEELLNNDLFSKVSINSGEYVTAEAKSSKFFLTYYRVMTLISVSVYAVFPLIEGDYRMAVPVYTPYNVTNPVNYYLSHAYQSVAIGMCGFLDTGIDVLFGMYCIVIYIRLKLLKDDLKKLDYGVSVKILTSQLKRCSLLHLEILRVTAITEEIFTYGVLAQFAAGVFAICFTGFKLLMAPAGSSELFNLIAYLQCMLIEVAIFCHYGHYVITESSDIGQALYQSNWYVSDLEARKDIVILMERFKKPIVLVAGKLFPLTMSTFTGILRSAYSFFAVLQQMDQ